MITVTCANPHNNPECEVHIEREKLRRNLHNVCYSCKVLGHKLYNQSLKHHVKKDTKKLSLKQEIDRLHREVRKKLGRITLLEARLKRTDNLPK